MLTLKPYPAYKTSALGALGAIPAHWSEVRAKYLFREIDQRSVSGDEELLSVSHITGVTPRSQKNVTMFMAESNVGHKRCHPDDLVINTMWAWMGALGVSRFSGIVSPSYGVYRPTTHRTRSGFIGQLLRTNLYIAEYVRRSTGINSSRLRLYPDGFLRIPILMPPVEEQDQITRFTNSVVRATSKLVRAKRRVIELLNEQKQAIIHRAVTRGLDPNVRLKPAGIEWLPEIPEHWKSIRLGTLAQSLQTGPFGSQLHSAEYISNGVPVINPSHMREGRIFPDNSCSVSPKRADELGRHKLEAGDVVFARRGVLGRCAVVTKTDRGCLCGTGSLRMQVRSELITPEFLVQLALSPEVGAWLSLQSIGSTMENLNTGILSRLPLPLPPVPEQKSILDHLTTRLAEVSSSQSLIAREIDLLQGYRTRLIADVVTGKLDVRGVELPELEDEEALEPLNEAEETEDEDAAVDEELEAVE